jgi:preprotein translocase subunit SecA
MNTQREAIYGQRVATLGGEDLWPMVEEFLDEVVESTIPEYVEEKQHPEDWKLKGLDDYVYQQFGLKNRFSEMNRDELNVEVIEEKLKSGVVSLLRSKEQNFGKPLMDYLMKVIMLQSIDNHWKDHLLGMDHLREGIGLRGYGQKDPVREYQKEGYSMFMEMDYHIKTDTLQKLCLVQIQKEEEAENLYDRSTQDYIATHSQMGGEKKPEKRDTKKVGRNDPCPCGSGKKYKKCCGQ